MDWIIFTIVISITLVMTLPCFGIRLKLFQEDFRMSDVSAVKTTCSVSECAAIFVTEASSLSFSYNEAERLCELSGHYPEQSNTTTAGWKVYVNVGWSLWTSWTGSCSLTCGDTRNRTRYCSYPNIDAVCSGQSFQEKACDGPCFNASDYFISTDKLGWGAAKTACTDRSMKLVKIDSHDEEVFLLALSGFSDFKHWIGMTCSQKVCNWLDGTAARDTWTNWGPDQPSGGPPCVWIGYKDNQWDDDYCYNLIYYICEQ